MAVVMFLAELSNENELYVYDVARQYNRLVAQHVHSFAIQDNFIFLSVQFPGLCRGNLE